MAMYWTYLRSDYWYIRRKGEMWYEEEPKKTH